ncbi:hypothetical protein [Cellulomonas sp. P24]|uniref:hypothetical protein n=1 Tax=Cellulomonas sp. P24 TaxID=2885206 RepID=UPI00216AC3B3|nr:hypothetical protein [Cellulomonas sp. P24]MCR6492085.1 hypothetical protein [Cellulomonas sp. P24]
MDRDAANAKGAELAGLTVATAVSAIPIFGGPAAVVAQYFGSIPAQQRVARILEELRCDVTRAFEELDGLQLGVLESEEFNAATMRVVRESLETADETKRQYLRNGLVNGYVAGEVDQRDRFLALIGAYEPSHVVVLRTLMTIEAGRTERVDNAQMLIARALSGSLAENAVWPLLRDLVGDGLVWEINDGRVTDEWVGSSPKKQSVVKPTIYHGVDPRGLAFLAFLDSPFDGAAAAD